MDENHINTDELLIRSFQLGSNAAFSDLYQRYSRGIYRKLLSMVKSKEDSEELLQEVFVRLWEKRDYLDPTRPIMPYLLQIASNLIYDLYRRTSREKQLQENILTASHKVYNPTEEIILYKESEALIHEAIALLPEQQRNVFVLAKLEGKTYKEISKQLNIGEATVSTHIVRATKSVKSHLFNAYGDMALLIAASLLLG